MENKKQVSTVKVNPIDTSTFRYNPMIVQLQTNEVKNLLSAEMLAYMRSNRTADISLQMMNPRQFIHKNKSEETTKSLLEKLITAVKEIKLPSKD